MLLALAAGVSVCLTACNRAPANNIAPSVGNAPGVKDQGSPHEGAQARRPQAVVTTRAHIESVPLVLEVQGSIVALDEVELRAQKNGVIQEVLVTDGSEVKKGQLLFTLDDRDDKANVQKAEAAVLSAEAGLSIAKRDLARNKDLSERNFISPSALDTAQNRVETADAAVALNKAALEQAVVSRTYNRILAPFDARAGRVDIRPGALVTSNVSSPALVKLTRMHPIGVNFALPERDLPALLAAQKIAPVKITAALDAHTELNGTVSFIDSAVDRTAGTISVKAKMDNAERRAWPGQFVNVRVLSGMIPNAVVLPAQAVINGPRGRLVYVVQDDNTVRAQDVELVRIFEQRAIVKGVSAGEKIVQEGAQNLRPGVQIVESHGDGGKSKPTSSDASSTPASNSTQSVTHAAEAEHK